MTVAFGIEPRPADWPKRTTYDCPYCEPEAARPRMSCQFCQNVGKIPTWDYGPTMSSSWTAGTIHDLVEALGLPCEEFPCTWPIEDFRVAMRNAGARARLNHAYAAIRRWLVGVDELTLPDGVEVYVA